VTTTSVVLPFARDLLEDGEDLAGSGTVEIARGLVREKKCRGMHQRARDATRCI
jgi:hypothetical protein